MLSTLTSSKVLGSPEDHLTGLQASLLTRTIFSQKTQPTKSKGALIKPSYMRVRAWLIASLTLMEHQSTSFKGKQMRLCSLDCKVDRETSTNTSEPTFGLSPKTSHIHLLSITQWTTRTAVLKIIILVSVGLTPQVKSWAICSQIFQLLELTLWPPKTMTGSPRVFTENSTSTNF